jgi:hypothetical protein
MAEYNLKHRDDLLAELASALKPFDNNRLSDLKVTFMDEDKNDLVAYHGLGPALEILVNDLYWGEQGDWSHARHIRVETY